MSQIGAISISPNGNAQAINNLQRKISILLLDKSKLHLKVPNTYIEKN